jgi:hypothetical protein
MKFSRRALFASVAIIFLAAACRTWLYWRSENQRLKHPQSILEETGLSIPNQAAIKTTSARLFSLVDSPNFAWHISSTSSLETWAAAHMKKEAGWERVKHLNEIGSFREQIPSNVELGQVWRSAIQVGAETRTAYLYLSEDGLTAILETFNP